MRYRGTIARIGVLWGFRVHRCGLPSLGGLCPHLLVAFILSLSLSSILMLTACSGEHVVEPEPVEKPGEDGTEQTSGASIAFSPNLPDEQPVTRGSVPLSETGVNSFRVWSYKNMSFEGGEYGNTQEVIPCYFVNWVNNSAYTTTSNTNGWEYVGQEGLGDPEQTIKYWDFGASAYRFFAATGWGGDAPVDPAAYEAGKAYKSAVTSTSYSVKMLADASSTAAMDGSPYFSRLWFSDGNAATYPDKQFGQPVTLEFVKPYSRVRFMFMYVFPRVGYNMGARSFHPTDDSNIVRKGTVTVVYPTSGAQTQEQYEVEGNADPDPSVSKALAAFTEDYDPEDESRSYTESVKGWYTVLPNTSQGSYTLTASINGSDRSVVVPAQFMQWKPGYQYTYVFKITEEGGVEIGWVEYAAKAWTEMLGDWTVYNW